MEKNIYVFYDDNEIKVLIGNLYSEFINGKEKFSFQFSNEYLTSPLKTLFLDPNLYLYNARQYPINDNIFGFLSDLAPDRWGRTLIKRREAILANKENRSKKQLIELDYLLNVYDESRIGAIRLSLDGKNYVSNDLELSVPPFEYIRKIETAVREFENNENLLDDKWLKQLIGPGSSLGGARPKATFKDNLNELWIAKFPSKNDEINSGAWEKTAHDLAKLCGLKTCEVKLENYSKYGSTFLIKRFDREKNKRIHFFSAMTALGLKDGDGKSNDHGYLDILSFIKMYSKNPKMDSLELFKRVVFNMCICNSDDHFRNHGFLGKDGSIELSPVYDINPNPYSEFLSINIDETSSLISIDTILNSSKYYDLTKEEALKIIDNIKNIIRENVYNIAIKNGIKESGFKYMKDAFKFSFED